MGQGYLFGSIPNIVLIWLAVVIVIFVMLKYTRFGREVYSVGGNAQGELSFRHQRQGDPL